MPSEVCLLLRRIFKILCCVSQIEEWLNLLKINTAVQCRSFVEVYGESRNVLSGNCLHTQGLCIVIVGY